ncbi:MAG: DUF1326 domain-containing protein [Treponema sp.]|nr:DUF1326 domain-containing protein [Treponema sp.]
MPDQINKSCKCTYPCNRHGDCKACIAYHVKTGSSTSCGKTGYDDDKK